jgi:hypothetical protein
LLFGSFLFIVSLRTQKKCSCPTIRQGKASCPLFAFYNNKKTKGETGEPVKNYNTKKKKKQKQPVKRKNKFSSTYVLESHIHLYILFYTSCRANSQLCIENEFIEIRKRHIVFFLQEYFLLIKEMKFNFFFPGPPRFFSFLFSSQ